MRLVNNGYRQITRFTNFIVDRRLSVDHTLNRFLNDL